METTAHYNAPSLIGFQVVPHVTDAIKNWIESVSVIPVDGKEGPADVCVIELGGTVGKQRDTWWSETLLLNFMFLSNLYFLFLGDIESMPFIEALRQLLFSVGKVALFDIFLSDVNCFMNCFCLWDPVFSFACLSLWC